MLPVAALHQGDLTWLEDPAPWLKTWPRNDLASSFTALGFAPDDLPHDLSDLEMTWLL